MIRKFLFSLAAAALLLSAMPAQAHFVWVAVLNSPSGQPQAYVFFGELAAEDDDALLDKIAQTKLSARSISGRAPLKLAKQASQGTGAWVGQLPEGAGALSATCNYGVLDKRGQVFLLQYYAKYLDAAHPGFKALARDEALPLDVVPGAAVGEKRPLTVVFQGKPVSGSEVVALDPTGKEEKLKTNDKGEVEIPSGVAGVYSIRAKLEVEQAGSENGKEYKKVVHYCTLALRTADGKNTTAATAKSDEAPEVMRRAREARAAWQKFPGFAADLKLFTDGHEQTGKIKVTAGGEVELSGFQLKDDKPVLTVLRSLVGHRMGSGGEDFDVSFAEEPTGHPFGRLIKFNSDTAMGSHYRIKDDVVREVNRKSENGRFTISVLEIRRNEEGKYLPGVYTVSFWNKDGSLKSTTTTNESWKRVGAFDLPLTHDSVATSANELRNLRMEFSGHTLLEAAAAK
ncbi:MAG: DUF3386 family protein [Pirellulaceae bacterium]|nr:DUF3386 family protein [Pirellulaceae bacterium]